MQDLKGLGHTNSAWKNQGWPPKGEDCVRNTQRQVHGIKQECQRTPPSLPGGHGLYPYLSKPLQVYDEHIRQGPEAQRDAPLLQLLTVWAAPGIIRGQLKTRRATVLSSLGKQGFLTDGSWTHFLARAWLVQLRISLKTTYDETQWKNNTRSGTQTSAA